MLLGYSVGYWLGWDARLGLLGRPGLLRYSDTQLGYLDWLINWDTRLAYSTGILD